MRLKRFTLDTRHYGVIQVLRPTPTEERQGGMVMVDPWGDLAPLRAVPEFASLLPVVTGEAFSHAMHGWAKPLMESIGPEPENQLRRVPQPFRTCFLKNQCVMHDPKRCTPGRKLPECWTPEVEEGARRAVAVVMLAWAEDRYVVVVEGDEFSL